MGEAESPADVRPRHLAVLAVLALAARPVPRDSLLGMFWGGEAEKRARHSLSNALSGLRAILGPEAISAHHDHVSVSDDARLEFDVLQFTAACETGDDARAASLYAGDFLVGVHVADAPEFDAWASRHRARLERQFVEVCERHVPMLVRARRWSEATNLAERWLDAAPRSSAAFVALLHAHAGPGTATALAGALDAYDRAERALAENYDVRPDASVVAVVSTLHQQLASVEGEPSSAGITTSNERLPRMSPVASTRASLPTIRRLPRARRWWWPAIGIAATLLFVAVWAMRRSPIVAAEATGPIVAVTTIDDVRGDSSIAWLRAGLPRMIATELDAMGGVEVVAPSRVRDVIVRLTGSSSARLTDDQAMNVARRVGARWSITGGVSSATGGYLLDVTMRDVTDAGETESFTILASNPIELGRLAASRLASLLAIGPGGGTPRYSGIGTANPDAYRLFIRGDLAGEAEQYSDAARALDSAIALDSGFVSAIRIRRDIADRLGDATTSRRLAAIEQRNANRLPEIDRLTDELRNVDSLGETPRADALSARLVERFAHDPRAYSTRADLLTSHGRWAAAESVLVRELALDSLAMVAGEGPCTPCEVLWRLSQVRIALADRSGAEAAARRWVALQPDLPAAWRNLSATLAAVGKSAEAADAGYHMVALSRDPPAAVDFGRTMLAARRDDIVDSLLRAWRGSSDPILVDGTHDLGAMLLRERGQFAASVDALSRLPASNGLSFVRADGLARLGRLGDARAILERGGHPPTALSNGQFTAPEARGFAWAHALEADELVRAGDTTDARALIDSIARAGQQSYYGRDKVLAHHVRGMLYFAQGKFADAERELRAAEWSANGWTRTNIELARAQLAEGHADDAIATLHDAYLAPVDAMARYVPRSEIDWWMARAFAAAGRADSASVYAREVRDEWRSADPIVRVRLDSVPR